jgi:predicted metalloprotease with PDZ domain
MTAQTARFEFRVAIERVAACVLALLLTGVAAAASTDPAPARYRLTLLDAASPRLAVTAVVPIEGSALTMDTTRPGDIPELDAGGWPSLVSHLRVTDAAGHPIETTSVGAAGWRLARPYTGRLTLEYEVDYAALAHRGWPAPREAAFVDGSDVVLVGRSMFITTHEVGTSRITFELPRGWRPVTPWESRPGSAAECAVSSAKDLVENLMVFSRAAPDVVTAGAFRLLVTPMGAWKSARGEVRRVLGAVIPRLVGLVKDDRHANYLVVLLPVAEHGGESYRHSFALTMETKPTRANSAVWGNLIAHEIFHLWNGWQLVGADYASSQWFQEGFTEYAANVSMVAAKLVSQEEFLQQLSEHIANYRKLTTTLEAGGSHKGPPLYSAGALVAFSWDAQIRDATAGRRNLWDFMNALYQGTGRGERPYAWQDIQAALAATVPYDWDTYYRFNIQGNGPLPVESALALMGLRLGPAAVGTPHVEIDPFASASSKRLWRALITGR